MDDRLTPEPPPLKNRPLRPRVIFENPLEGKDLLVVIAIVAYVIIAIVTLVSHQPPALTEEIMGGGAVACVVLALILYVFPYI